MRIAHYLNQFFAGVGGEQEAGMPLEIREGAVGPGKLFEQLIGGDAKVVLTLVCGDNYAVEDQDQMVAAAVQKIRQANADLLIAGPCFQAGRYGMAAGALCSAVQSQLNIPVLAGMSEENPGTDLYRELMYIVDSGANAANMRDAVRKMAALARKLIDHQPIGLPKEENYFTRGFIRDRFVEQTAGQRLVDMVLAKVKGEPFESEMAPTTFSPVPMPPGVKDLTRAKLLLITDGGLVPKGNPDKIEGSARGSRPAGAARCYARAGKIRSYWRIARRIPFDFGFGQSVIEHAADGAGDGRQG
jgi:glycine reductase